MELSLSLRYLFVDVGPEEGFTTPQTAIFETERFLTRDKKKFYLSGGSWLIPDGDGYNYNESEMDDESKEKLMPLITKAAIGLGCEVEFR
jgi:hypothetical protein